jgi:hypothetical protein
LEEAANVLNESEFQAVFGHPRDTRVDLIEPQILLNAVAGVDKRT